MTLDVIDTFDGLRLLEREWQFLVDQLPFSSPFQLPLWQLTWWSHFGSGELRVLAFRDSGKLVGVIPSFLHTWNGKRQLTLLGSGISDWTDPPVCDSVLPLLQRHLQDDRAWDVLDWQDLSASTPLRSLNGLLVADDVPCSQIPLTGSFEAFWSSRSKDLRRNLRRYSQRAREEGTVTFQVSQAADASLMGDLVRLHALRWRKQGQSGMISANNSEEFLRDIVEKLAAVDAIRFFAVRFKQETVAVTLTFHHRNCIFSYMSAFDPQHEILGFGRMLLYESIKYSYDHGYQAWNFLRGNEPYKASWGAEPIAKIRLYSAR